MGLQADITPHYKGKKHCEDTEPDTYILSEVLTNCFVNFCSVKINHGWLRAMHDVIFKKKPFQGLRVAAAVSV